MVTSSTNSWGSLQEANENCLLLSDLSGAIGDQIRRAVQAWPDKYRKKGEMLLTQLKKRRRFVDLNVGPLQSFSCTHGACRIAVNIAKGSTAKVLICRRACRAGMSAATETLLVSPDEYHASDFSDLRREAERRELGEGELTPERFAAEVCAPVFRYAKWVRIIDRWVAKHLLARDNDACEIRPRWRESLTWLARVLAAHAAAMQKPQLVIFSDLFGEDQFREARARKDLDAFEEAVCTETGCSLQIVTPALQAPFPHDRYLITDQIALEFSRGFDLLNRRRVRAVTISISRSNARELMRRLEQAGSGRRSQAPSHRR